MRFLVFLCILRFRFLAKFVFSTLQSRSCGGPSHGLTGKGLRMPSILGVSVSRTPHSDVNGIPSNSMRGRHKALGGWGGGKKQSHKKCSVVQCLIVCCNFLTHAHLSCALAFIQTSKSSLKNLNDKKPTAAASTPPNRKGGANSDLAICD